MAAARPASRAAVVVRASSESSSRREVSGLAGLCSISWSLTGTAICRRACINTVGTVHLSLLFVVRINLAVLALEISYLACRTVGTKVDSSSILLPPQLLGLGAALVAFTLNLAPAQAGVVSTQSSSWYIGVSTKLLDQHHHNQS